MTVLYLPQFSSEQVFHFKLSVMSKKKIVLQFPNLFMLWNFAQGIKANSLEINTGNKTLTCDCSETEASLAIEKYNAVLIAELLERLD
jgi:hypothetical protein